MRRLVSYLLVSVLAFGLGIAANFMAQHSMTVAESMPPATEYDLTSPLPTDRICEVHGERMHREVVPLHHVGEADLQVTSDSYGAEFANHFPHAATAVSIFDRSIADDQTVTIYVCSQCRAAQAAWWKKHRGSLCRC